MTAAGTPASSRRHTEMWIAGTVLVADQVTKAVVRNQLDLHESVTVIPGLLDLTRVHNTGAAFGLFNAAEFPFKSVVLVLVATSALAGVALYAAMLPPAQWLARIGLAF